MSHKLIKRLRFKSSEDKSLDILVTGCEVSLWLAEQFAADLLLVFPKLRVKAVSANKLLGLLGQDFPVPATGFDTHEQRLDLTNSVVIVVSHSGGTFSSLVSSV